MTILFRLGFRPFFLLAGLSGVVLVPLWVAALSGQLTVGHPPGVTWHAHEMLYGYVAAVLAGFFLTATPKWTKSSPVTGVALALLVLLWILGRVAFLTALPNGVELLFLPALTLAIAWPIVKARSRRNLLFPVLLATLWAADLALHGGLAGLWTLEPSVAWRVAVLAVSGVIVIFGGRITPLFTRNALKERVQVRPRSRLDDAAIASVLLLIPVQFVQLPELEAGLAFVAAGLNAARLWGWGGSATLRQPILWVLHLGYAWLPVALLALAISALWPEQLTPSTGLHALTVGFMGTYTLGMMTRVSLGHTGRPLRVGRAITVAYVCVLLAGLLRVLGPPLGMGDGALHGAGSLWSLGFLLFLVVYVPVLLKPRVEKG